MRLLKHLKCVEENWRTGLIIETHNACILEASYQGTALEAIETKNTTTETITVAVAGVIVVSAVITVGDIMIAPVNQTLVEAVTHFLVQMKIDDFEDMKIAELTES